MAQTSLTIHIDEDFMHEAETLFEQMGVSISTAIHMFISKAVQKQAIPFEYSSYDAFYNSPEALEALEESKQLLNDPNAKSFNTMHELIADLLNDDDDD